MHFPRTFSRFLVRRLLVGAVGAAGMASAVSLSAPLSPGPRRDAGDGYRAGGRWKPLRRMTGEFVVDAETAAALKPDERFELVPGGRLPAASLRLVRRAASAVAGRASGRGAGEDLDRLRGRLGKHRVNPVFADPRTGVRLAPRGRIVVCLAPGADPDLLPPRYGPLSPLPGTADQFVLSLPNRTAEALLAAVSELDALPGVAWAEPDFLKEWRRNLVLDDPMLGQQWHLSNPGTQWSDGTPYSPAGVDIGAPGAWDRNTGDPAIVIAMLDDGVPSAHPDLQANLFSNPGEIAGNGLDDDGNGYVDDISGWDFVNNHSSAEPKVADDRHGTATAGLAAAVGNNGLGVSGVAPGGRILPVKIFQGSSFAGSSELANAVRYAAGLTAPQAWRGADVLSMSFGGGAPTAIEDSAFADAASRGRAGRGCALVASAGNSAHYYKEFRSPELPAGDYVFEWRYRKDERVSAFEDTCRIGLVIFPDGALERFDDPAPPPGWNFHPDPAEYAWVIEDNPARSFGLGRYQARPAEMTRNNSQALCRSPTISISVPGALSFYYWISSEAGYDVIEFRAVRAGDPPPAFTVVDSGDPATDSYVWYDPYVAYPASHPDVIAVGASTEFDYRSYFSQYGDDLDLMAPGGGGFLGIVTTDRTGADGYNSSGDYTTGFSGTSASAPIVSGAVALLLSRHPDLTAGEVRTLLRRTADKTGGLAYSGGEAGAGGRNPYYGYGRLNAERLLGLARITTDPGFGGLEAGIDGSAALFCEPGSQHTLHALADTYFDFLQWTAEPAVHAALFQPAQADSMVTVYDDVTLTAAFSALTAARGTPLYWLDGHGLSTPSFDAAEREDADGDGHAAWEEWIAGSDPTNAASVLRIETFDRRTDGRCVLQWPSATGRVYDVLAFETPDAGPVPLAESLPATPPSNVHTSVPLPSGTRFFRVRARIP